jgi:hypothetical protein
VRCPGREILSSYGFSEQDIAQLEANKIVAQDACLAATEPKYEAKRQ